MLIRRVIMLIGVLGRIMGNLNPEIKGIILNKVMLLSRDTNHNKAIPNKDTHSSNVIHSSKVTHSSKVIHNSSKVTLHSSKGILLNSQGILPMVILLQVILLKVILLKRLPFREILPISEL